VHLLATGAVAVSLVRVSSTGVETVLKSDVTITSIGTTYTPGTQLRFRFQVTGTGTTTLRAKVWKVGSAEPAAWTATVTDTTAALQVAGSVGVMGYLSSTATNAPIVIKVDDFRQVPPTEHTRHDPSLAGHPRMPGRAFPGPVRPVHATSTPSGGAVSLYEQQRAVLVVQPSVQLYGADRMLLESVAALGEAGWRVVVVVR